MKKTAQEPKVTDNPLYGDTASARSRVHLRQADTWQTAEG